MAETKALVKDLPVDQRRAIVVVPEGKDDDDSGVGGAVLGGVLGFFLGGPWGAAPEPRPALR